MAYVLRISNEHEDCALESYIPSGPKIKHEDAESYLASDCMRYDRFETGRWAQPADWTVTTCATDASDRHAFLSFYEQRNDLVHLYYTWL